jgi:hypothetical protein
MSHEIKPLEALFLWRLAVGGGGDWLKDIKPDPQSPARKKLETNGLIEQVKPTFRTSAVDFLRIPVRTARARWLRIAMAVREVPR